MFVVVLVVSCAWMLFTPHEPVILAAAPAPAPGAGPGPDDDADIQVPTWHVARADAYDTTGVRTAALDDGDWDVDENTGNGEFDSYEDFTNDDPADSVVTPESNEQETGRQD